MEAGRYETGCQAIAESQRLDPRPGTLFTLATCEQRWGHAATALALFGDYLALYERLPDDEKTKQGERPKVARVQRDKLVLEIRSAPPEVVPPPAPVAVPAAPAPAAGPSGRRIAAFVIGGVGIAGLAVGGVTGTW